MQVVSSSSSLTRQLTHYGAYLETHRTAIDRYDLGFGQLGVALFFLYAYRLEGHPADLERARDCFHDCLRGIGQGPTATSFLSATTEGLIFCHHYAGELGMEAEASVLVEALNPLLRRHGKALLRRRQLDPYTGAFAVGYALLLTEAEPATIDPYLAAIPTDASHLAAKDGRGRYHVPSGISHGLAFYLLFATEASRRFGGEKRRHLVAKLQSALLARLVDFHRHHCFFLDGKDYGKPSRLALAYGDLGILYALYRSAEYLQQSELAAQCLRWLATTGTRRSGREGAPTDNRLLYGYSGVHYFYATLGRRTGDPDLLRLAEYWEGRQVSALADLPVPSTGAGFNDYDYPAMQRVSFLEGGIGQLLAPIALRTHSIDFTHQLYLL
ncbi:MAG: lanthionine synthetase LanC family protein [Bacteroidota bacterium]